MTALPEVLTTAEAAVVLRCTPEHVAQMCRDRKIAAANLGGPLGYRIRRDALDAFLAGRTRPARGTTAEKKRKRAW